MITLPVGFTLAQVLAASSSVAPNAVTSEPVASRITATLAMLDRAAALVNRRGDLRVTSLMRSPSHNEAVGGAAHSSHLTGYGADFVIPGVSHGVLFDAFRAVPELIGFDELIVYDDHLHMSADPRARGKVIDKRTAAPSASNRPGAAAVLPLSLLALVLILAWYLLGGG